MCLTTSKQSQLQPNIKRAAHDKKVIKYSNDARDQEIKLQRK